MKSKILLLLLAISFLFSCEINNTSQADITTADIVGTWNLTDFRIENAVLNSITPDSAIYTASGFGKNYNGSITFSENPNKISIKGNFIFELTYKNGQTFTENIYLDAALFNDAFNSVSSTWNLDQNILSIIENGEIIEINIKEFTGSKIVIETEINQTISISNTTADVSGKAFITLEK
jgi:hypothetical protein